MHDFTSSFYEMYHVLFLVFKQILFFYEFSIVNQIVVRSLGYFPFVLSYN